MLEEAAMALLLLDNGKVGSPGCYPARNACGVHACHDRPLRAYPQGSMLKGVCDTCALSPMHALKAAESQARAHHACCAHALTRARAWRMPG